MRSSRRAVGWALVILLGCLGLLLLATPLLGAAHSGLLVVLGVAMLAAAAVVWLTRVDGPDPVRRTSLGELDGQPALIIALRPTTPLVMCVLGVAFGALFGFAALAVGLSDGGLLFLPLVALFLVLVPDAARALARGPRLALGVDHVDLRGWGIDARLAWPDVARVQVEDTDPRRARLLLLGRPGASSWRHRMHRYVVALDRRPATPEIAVPVSALDAPSRVQVLAARFAGSDRAGRQGFLDAEGVAFLSRQR